MSVITLVKSICLKTGDGSQNFEVLILILSEALLVSLCDSMELLPNQKVGRDRCLDGLWTVPRQGGYLA